MTTDVRVINLLYDYRIDPFADIPPAKEIYNRLKAESALSCVSELNLLNRDNLSKADFLRAINAINLRGDSLGFCIVFA